MRLSRRRLTARDLMIALAAFAISLKVGLVYSRSARYWQEANSLAYTAMMYRQVADLQAAQVQPPGVSLSLPALGVIAASGDGPDPRGAERSRAFATFLDRQSRQYRWAALLPWLRSAPELP